MFKMKQVLVMVVALSFLAHPVLFALAEDAQTSRVVTLKSVELKDEQGHWQKAIESSKQVDLAREQPILYFFNHGRVPEGNFVNFRITFSEGTGDLFSETSICGRKDFPLGPAVIKKESFVSVGFEPSLPSNEIKKLELTLDDIVVTWTENEDLLVETKGNQKWH